MSADFVVAGGGIGGAVVAELLGRGGKRVVVIERSTAPPGWVRPEVLWPATVDALRSLLPWDELEGQAAIPVAGVQVRAGGHAVSLLDREVFREAGIQPWFTDPNRTREALLGLGSFELRRGVEVVAVLREGDRVLGVRTRDVATGMERECLAHWTVGDDGAQSMVRAACGIELRTRMFPVDFLCFGFEWPAVLPQAKACIWLNVEHAASGVLALAAIPVAAARGAGLVVVRPWIFERDEAASAGWSRLVAGDEAIAKVVGDRRFPRDLARVRRPWGHAPRYGCRGAVLMGDAAHPVSPAGGQGASMAVADACALAQLALENHANLLEAYEQRRRAANERSLAATRWAARLWGLPAWCSPVSIAGVALRWLAGRRAMQRRLLRSASTAFLEE